MSKIFEHHPNINFFQVNTEGWVIPKDWEQWSNFNFITLDEFSDFIIECLILGAPLFCKSYYLI